MPNAEFVIDRDALRHNLRIARALVGEARVIAVVKANAYGHGLETVGPWMLEDGADLLAVADVSEAVALGGCCPDGCARVLVLGGVLPDEAPEAVGSGAILAAQSLAAAEDLSQTAERMRATVRVHLKVDTGLSRLGAPWRTAHDAAARVAALPGLRLEGAFTHLACADEADDGHARLQLERWGRVCERLPQGLLLHCLASAGAVRYPEWRQGAVRLGLVAYGIDPLAQVPAPALRPALTFASRLMQTRDLEAGESISYGATHRAEKPMRVGVVPVGYADGYPRSLSGVGAVLVRGRRAPILGRICMDRFMVDLSGAPGVSAGHRHSLPGSGGDPHRRGSPRERRRPRRGEHRARAALALGSARPAPLHRRLTHGNDGSPRTSPMLSSARRRPRRRSERGCGWPRGKWTNR